jgi:hypothetical protein
MAVEGRSEAAGAFLSAPLPACFYLFRLATDFSIPPFKGLVYFTGKSSSDFL